MEPGRYILTFPVEPQDLLPRLEQALATQGAPPVTVRRADGRFVFEGDTAEMMVRARAGDALSSVWAAWRDLAVEPAAQGPRPGGPAVDR